MKRNSLVIFSFLLVAFLAHAQSYKCEINGKTSFQDRPCAPAETATALDIEPPPNAFTADPQTPLDAMENLRRRHNMAGRNAICTKEKIHSALTQTLMHYEQMLTVCGKPGDVTKEEAVSVMPGWTIMANSPQAGMKIISWTTDRGYSLRLEWLEAADVIGSAALLSHDFGKPATPKIGSAPMPAGQAAECPCSGSRNCYGPKGGSFCITTNGSKRYR